MLRDFPREGVARRIRPAHCQSKGGIGRNEIEPASYQVTRRVNCNVRGLFPEFRVARIPVLPTLFGFPGWFSTLKKSALSRTKARSLMGTVLKIEASRPHWRTLGMYCCRSGARPAQVVRWVVPSFSVTNWVLPP